MINEEEKNLLNSNSKKALIQDDEIFTEPQSLKDKKEISLNPLSVCMENSVNCTFDQNELKYFYDLIKESNESFSEKKGEHCLLIKKLFKYAKKEINFEKKKKDLNLEKKEEINFLEKDEENFIKKDENNLIEKNKEENSIKNKENYNEVNFHKKILDNENWKKMGFQNSHPSTDFRGGGVLSLKCLIKFCKEEKEVFKEIIIFSEKYENYIFACVLISSVFFLKNFLHFGIFNQYKKNLDYKKLSSRSVLKFFLNLKKTKNLKNTFKNDFHFFSELINFYNKKVFFLWKLSFFNNQKLRIIDFKQVEDIIKENFILAFEKISKLELYGNYDLERFYHVFNNLPIKKDIKPYVF